MRRPDVQPGAPVRQAVGVNSRAARSSTRVVGSSIAVSAAAITMLVTPLACSSRVDDAAVATTTTIAATSSSSTSSTSTSSTTSTSTTTTLPMITEGGVVLVANSSGKRNAAQKLATELGNLGFTVQGVTNGALYEESLDVSKVYVRPGGEAAAESIARLMGGIEVLRMPTPVWIVGGPDALGYANVLVMLGADKGGLTLAEMDDVPAGQP